jgi:hypothetical protein
VSKGKPLPIRLGYQEKSSGYWGCPSPTPSNAALLVSCATNPRWCSGSDLPSWPSRLGDGTSYRKRAPRSDLSVQWVSSSLARLTSFLQMQDCSHGRNSVSHRLVGKGLCHQRGAGKISPENPHGNVSFSGTEASDAGASVPRVGARCECSSVGDVESAHVPTMAYRTTSMR